MIFDSTKHDEISFAEAVARMKSGDNVFAGNGFEYRMSSGGTLLSKHAGVEYGFAETELKVSKALQMSWYIKKPFDVRQTMRDNPDKWVGAYQDAHTAEIYKVGFDSKEFRAISSEIGAKVPVVHAHGAGTYEVYGDDLDRCIPIDEVAPYAR